MDPLANKIIIMEYEMKKCVQDIPRSLEFRGSVLALFYCINLFVANIVKFYSIVKIF